MLISVVVPTLEEAGEVTALLDHLAEFDEVVIADGGSADDTCALAACHPRGPLLVHTDRGRARQLNAGAAAARGEVLVFLHADTRLPSGAAGLIERALRNPSVLGGNFALRFDGGDRFSALLSRWYALQRRLGVYYGDSVLWCRREVFDMLGGFRELPIMEDYDFVRKLERAGRTLCLPGPAVTSARRWRQHGLARTVGAWVLIRWLYLAGVCPDRLARLYPVIR